MTTPFESVQALRRTYAFRLVCWLMKRKGYVFCVSDDEATVVANYPTFRKEGLQV